MHVTRRSAIGLCGLTLLGATAATYCDVAADFGIDTNVSADAAPIGGTIVHTAASGGFETQKQRRWG